MMFGSLLLLIAGGALAWQAMQRAPRAEEEGKAKALRILAERYARGEINRQEYEERRRTLEEG